MRRQSLTMISSSRLLIAIIALLQTTTLTLPFVSAWIPFMPLPVSSPVSSSTIRSSRTVPFAWRPSAFRNSNAIINSNSNNNEYNDNVNEEEATCDAESSMIRAGNLLKGINEDAGSAICRAASSWSRDWSKVAEALEEAAHAFWDISKKEDLSPKLQNICRSVAQELEDVSTIEGCTSIGPATSVPNWIEISSYLNSAAADFEKGKDDRDKKYFDILQKTGKEVEIFIESI